jgi:hypothetical protein
LVGTVLAAGFCTSSGAPAFALHSRGIGSGRRVPPTPLLR